jgi:hypothetical protein
MKFDKFYTAIAFFAPKEATFRHNYYDQVALILKELSNEPNIIAQLTSLVSGSVASTPLRLSIKTANIVSVARKNICSLELSRDLGSPFFFGAWRPVAWPMWNAMFRDHIVAYDRDSMRTVAFSCSSLGAEGFKVCLSMCPRGDLTLKEVMDKLQARFAPKVRKFVKSLC